MIEKGQPLMTAQEYAQPGFSPKPSFTYPSTRGKSCIRALARSRRSGKLELMAVVEVLEVLSGLMRALGVLGAVDAPKMPDLVWIPARGCEGPNRSSTNRNTESIGLSIR